MIIKLNEILANKEISVNKLSQESGVARTTITPLIKNPSDISSVKLSTLDKLAKYLNVSIFDIIDEEKDNTFNLESLLISKNKNYLVFEVSSQKNGKFFSFYLIAHIEISSWEEIEKELELPSLPKLNSIRVSIEVMNSRELELLEMKWQKLEPQYPLLSQEEVYNTLKKTNETDITDLLMLISNKISNIDIYKKETTEIIVIAEFPRKNVEAPYSITSLWDDKKEKMVTLEQFLLNSRDNDSEELFSYEPEKNKIILEWFEQE